MTGKQDRNPIPQDLLEINLHINLVSLFLLWLAFMAIVLRDGGRVEWRGVTEGAAVVVICIVYGATKRLLRFVPGVEFGLLNWLADIAIVGFIMFYSFVLLRLLGG